MGFDGIYKIYHKHDDKYEEVAFYNKKGEELGPLFPSRDGMLNQLLLDYNRNGYDFDPIAYRRGLPDWYVDMVREKHPDWFDGSSGWQFNLKEGTYYDYLELRGWAQGNTCEFKDWAVVEFDEDDGVISETVPKRNALKEFMTTVDIYLQMYHIWYPKPGEVIIVCEMGY